MQFQSHSLSVLRIFWNCRFTCHSSIDNCALPAKGTSISLRLVTLNKLILLYYCIVFFYIENFIDCDINIRLTNIDLFDRIFQNQLIYSGGTVYHLYFGLFRGYNDYFNDILLPQRN